MLHARRNKVNGLYFSGRPTDLQTRTKVLDMYLQGKAFSEISKTTGLTARGRLEKFANTMKIQVL